MPQKDRQRPPRAGAAAGCCVYPRRHQRASAATKSRTGQMQPPGVGLISDATAGAQLTGKNSPIDKCVFSVYNKLAR